eukprot:gene9170-11238_t
MNGKSNGTDDGEIHFTLESVQNALQLFYFPQNQNGDYSTVIQTLQDWLVLFQNSQSAWYIAPLLLNSNIKEIQYFGASTIEGKVKTHWLTLSNEMKLELRNSLLNFLKNQQSIQNVVLTRLCLAISVIACHSAAETWDNPIEDVLGLAFPDTNNLDIFNPQKLSLMLELLTIFPDELLNSDYITQQKRSKVGIEFSKYSQKIIQILYKIVSLNYTPITLIFMKGAIKCLKSWILFDIPPSEFLIDTPLILKCFESVSKNPILVEDFTNLLDELFSFMHGKHFKSYPSTFNPIIEKIIDVLSPYYFLALQEDNQMICNSIFLLFSHISENLSKSLLASSNGERFLNVLLEFARRSDTEICELLFPVVSEIRQLQEDKVDISPWYGVLADMIEIFRVKCMIPDDYYPVSNPPTIEQEKFNSFRTSAADSLLEIYTIIESKSLEVLLTKLWLDINSFSSSQQQQQQQQTQCKWQSLESTIYLLGCLSEVASEGATFIPQLFSLVGQMPVQSTPLVKSTIVLAGKYANLMKDSVQFLEKIVIDFIPAFSNNELKGVATDSFLSISKNNICASLLSKNINVLIKLCEPYLLQSNNTDETNLKILEALLYIVSILPPNDILTLSSQLITPHVHILNQFRNSNTQQIKEIHILMNSLKALTDFFKIFDTENDLKEQTSPQLTPPPPPIQQTDLQHHPILPIINHIIPIIGDLLKIYYNDKTILESISKFYKKAMIACSRDSTLIVPEISKQLTEAFVKCQLGSILNSLSFGVSTLPTNQPFEFLTQSITTIATVVVETWRKYADKSKSFKLSPSPSEKSTTSTSSLSPIAPPPQQQYNLSIYPDAIGGGSPRSIIPFISEVIFALISHYPSMFRPIALRILSVDGFPTSNITMAQKETFLNNVMR